MTKEEFLEGLKKALFSTGSASLIEENIRFYSSYIDDEVAKGRSMDDIMDELGEPRLIANSIKVAHGYEDVFVGLNAKEEDMNFEENMSTENAQFVCQWSNSLGKSFQEQWMGPMIPFPLTIQILQDLEGIFSIFDGQEFVGLIQKIRLEDRNLHIGRFFINPQKQGQGLGSQALRKFVSLAFKNEDIDTISLNVYEANQTAYNLYQKEGFEIVQMVETPIRKYIMKKGR